MAISIFKAFSSTVTAFTARVISSNDRWLTDPTTGAITGVQTQTGNGPNARFVPVDITAAQLVSPTPAMIADLDATYRLNVAPYSRFQSDGAQLVALGGGSTEVIVPSFENLIWYAPLTVSGTQELIIQGQVRLQTYPA
jgi:hypothetical protein